MTRTLIPHAIPSDTTKLNIVAAFIAPLAKNHHHVWTHQRMATVMRTPSILIPERLSWWLGLVGPAVRDGNAVRPTRALTVTVTPPTLTGRGLELFSFLAPPCDGFTALGTEIPYGLLFDLIVTPARFGEMVGEHLAPRGTIVILGTDQPEALSVSTALAERLHANRGTVAVEGTAYDFLYWRPEPLGDGPGKAMLDLLRTFPGMPECQLCHALASDMNRWGREKCRGEMLPVIVDDMLPRARKWWGQARPWMRADAFFRGKTGLWSAAREAVSAGSGERLDAILRTAIRDLVIEATR